MSWYTSPKFWTFVGGMVSAGVLGVAAKEPKVRQAAVTVVAKGMECQQACSESFQNFKDDASDMAEEARRQAKLDAASQDRKAKIEARVREIVEKEFAEEEAKAAAEAAKAEEAAE